MATIEEERMGQLQQERLENSPDEEIIASETTLSFGKKVSQHWLILAGAALFDIIGIIPGIAVVFNFIFGLILYLYFGSKKKTRGSELLKIGLPIMGGSIVDFFIGILPVNIGAALIRIALS